MPLAKKLIPAAERQTIAKDARVVDTLILPYAQRTAKSGFVFGTGGTCVELNFEDPVCMRTDDALLLDDGNLVEVVAEAESLFEVRVENPVTMARLAWHFGDNHVPVEIRKNRLRLQRNPELEAAMEAAGTKIVAIEAPFDPEDGGPHGDDHHHHPHHDHRHHQGHGHHHARHHGHDHAHGHAHEPGHDHDHDGHGHAHHHDHDHPPKRG